ncbi:hypothetical protein L204_103834 [Cryptococcus depauperatus]
MPNTTSNLHNTNISTESPTTSAGPSIARSEVIEEGSTSAEESGSDSENSLSSDSARQRDSEDSESISDSGEVSGYNAQSGPDSEQDNLTEREGEEEDSAAASDGSDSEASAAEATETPKSPGSRSAPDTPPASAARSARSIIQSEDGQAIEVEAQEQDDTLNVKTEEKTKSRKHSVSTEKSRPRLKTPRTWQQEMIRYVSLYVVPILFIIPLSLLLSLNTILLTPLYNSIPLSLHTPSLYVFLSVPPSILYWAITLHHPTRDVISASVCLSLAALGGESIVVWGRRVGSLTGRVAGGEWGAWGARGILGLTSVGGNLGFALLCFDFMSPIPPTTKATDGIKNLINISIRSTIYMLHVWFGERIWDKILANDMYMFTPSPEKSILFISLLLTATSLLVRRSVSPLPFSRQTQKLILSTFKLSSSKRAKIKQITSILPRRALPLILFLRLPILILALRQHIYLRPTSSQSYVTARGELRVHTSERSITGQIVVADNLRDGYRFLRCDHSILGGRWIREKEIDGGQKKVEMGDSIFAVFNLQEAATLAHRSDTKESLARTLSLTTDLQVTLEGEDDVDVEESQRTLIIGLGVGISAQGYVRRGHHVDIVEIDPAIYAAATTYFDLPSSLLTSVNVMDGASFVSELATIARTNISDPSLSSEDAAALERVPKWTHVIQDCFTGGALPGEMFTKEFWEDLGELVVEDGIIAMNFVGLRKSKASRAVLVTLLSVFPQCRAFGDGFETNQGSNEVTNMVVFCTKIYSPLLSFRPPRSSDVRRSPLRSHVFSTFLAHEIQLDEIISEGDMDNPDMLLRRGNVEKLNKWQRTTAIATWKAMQKILTPEMWLAY